MAAIPTIASNQPIPEPRAYTTVSPTDSNPLPCINNDAPNIAQFTAISGKNIPSALYNAGANFSTIISNNCTIEATTAMNNMKVRKLKSTEAKSGLIQVRAPSFKT